MKKTNDSIEAELLVYVPDVLKKELQMLAIREGRTLKSIITEISTDYVKKHKQGNPQHIITNFIENEDFTGFPAMGIDYDNKKQYITKHLQDDGKMNILGKELWGHVCQWYEELRKL